MRHGIQHPVVNDSGFKIWNDYAVRAWPTLVLIDPRGRIAGEVSGEIQAEVFAQHIHEVIAQNEQELDRAPLEQRLEINMQPERPLRFPSKLLIAGRSLFVADTGHHRILEIQLNEDGMAGRLARVIGSGYPGLSDGPIADATFNSPHGLGLRGSPTGGNLFVADTENHALRAVDLATGLVRTIAGTGEKAHGRFVLGSPTKTPLRSPWAVLPLEQYLFVAMAGSHQIWVLTDEGQLGPFAGNGVEDLVDGPVGESSFNQPSDLAYGMGYLFVADAEASAIRAVSLMQDPKTITLVGQGLFDFGDQDGPSGSALLQHPTGLAFSGGQIYVADTYNHKIKRLDPAGGVVQTLIGDGTRGWRDGPFNQACLFEPEGVIVSGRLLYIADTNNHLLRVADLQTEMLHTFQLKGIENIPTTVLKQPEQVLPPHAVAPGLVTVQLDVRLPSGYKRSTDAPAVIQLVGEGHEPIFFAAGEPLQLDVQVDGDTQITLALSIYYCQEQAAHLCMIHRNLVTIPLLARAGGWRKIFVPYPIAVDGGNTGP